MSLSAGAAWVSALGAASLPVLVDAAIKGSAILAMACMASVFVRRASAATRHLVWFLALASLLAMPALSWVLPGWQVLPGWVDVARPAAHDAPALEPPPWAPATGVSEPVPIPDHPSVAGDPPAPPGPVPAMPDAPAPVRAAAPSPWSAAAVGAWLVPVWALGAAAALVPALLGAMSLWLLARSARRVTDGPWMALLERLSAGLGLRRRVALLASDRRSMPMAWGVWRPRLLLPAEAERWPPGCLCAVLLHELAHVKRWDCVTQLVMRIACGLYWFNPLAWVAFRSAVAEHERACDDVVLASGGKPSEYAEYLLDVASRLPGRRFTLGVAIALARPSRLEGRLLAILDGTRSRRAVTRAAMLGAILALAAVLVPLAALRGTVKAENERPDARAFAASLLNAAKAGDAEACRSLIGDEELARQLAGYAASHDLRSLRPEALYASRRELVILSNPVKRKDGSAAEVLCLALVRTQKGWGAGEAAVESPQAAAVDLHDLWRRIPDLEPLDTGADADRSATAFRPPPLPSGSEIAGSVQARLTAEAEKEYRRWMTLPLVAELRNNGATALPPIVLMGARAAVEATDGDGIPLRIRPLADVLPWEARLHPNGLAPGGSIQWRLWFDRLAFIDRPAAGSIVRLRLHIKGRDFDVVSGWAELAMKEPLPVVLEPECMPSVWMPVMDLVYRECGGASVGGTPLDPSGEVHAFADRAVHVDGRSGRVTVAVMTGGKDAWVGRYEAALGRDNLDRLADFLKRQQVRKLPELTSEPAGDESMRFSLSSGGRLLDVEFPLDQVAREPTLLALRKEMWALMAKVVARMRDDLKGWGPVDDEGVQSRLRAEKREWPLGQAPTLVADVRNLGMRDPWVAQAQQAWEVAVDGQWYQWTGDKGLKYSPLEPGREYHDIRFTLGSEWRSKDGDRPLSLGAGKHTVRVAAVCMTHEEKSPMRPMGASNVVEIAIQPATVATAGSSIASAKVTGAPPTAAGAAVSIPGVGDVSTDTRTLDLRGKKATDGDLAKLKELGDMDVLYVDGAGITDAGLKELRGLKSLRELHLWDGGFTDAGLTELAGVGGLEVLYLRGGRITPAGLKELGSIKGLRELHLDDLSISTDAGLKQLAGLRSLAVLYAGGANVTDDGLKELRGLMNLRALFLRQSRIRDEGLAALGDLQHLEALDVGCTGVGDAGLKAIARFKALRSLNVMASNITDAGLKELKDLHGLERLNLRHTKITDAGLKELETLEGLREIWLLASGVSDAGRARLREALPQLKIDPPAAALTVPRVAAAEVAWSEALNGLRVRLTAPSGTVYRRRAALPLLVEVQNASDKPIPFSKLVPEFRIRAADAKGAWLGIPRRSRELNPWEGRTGSLAPGEIVSLTVRFDRLRFIKPLEIGSTISLTVSAPTQLVVPGKLPTEVYSPPVTIQVQDEFPSLLAEADMTGQWTDGMDMTYWQYLGLSGHWAIHIDEQGRVTMLSRLRGRDEGIMPPGRIEAVLDKQRLDRLARLLRDQHVWTLAGLKRDIAGSDEEEMGLSLSVGGAALVGDYPLHVAKGQPALMALRDEMRALAADTVAAALNQWLQGKEVVEVWFAGPHIEPLELRDSLRTKPAENFSLGAGEGAGLGSFVEVVLKVTPENTARLLDLQSELAPRHYLLRPDHMRVWSTVGDPAKRAQARKLVPEILSVLEKSLAKVSASAKFTPRSARGHLGGLQYDLGGGNTGMMYVFEITSAKSTWVDFAIPRDQSAHFLQLGLMVRAWYRHGLESEDEPVSTTHSAVRKAIFEALEPLLELEPSVKVVEGTKALGGRAEKPGAPESAPLLAAGGPDAAADRPPGRLAEVRGRVLDCSGKPVPGAKVFVAGRRMVEFRPEHHLPTPTTETDAEGRFHLSSAQADGAKAIVVSTPSLRAWSMALNGTGEEVSLRLPEPGTLVLRYRMEGDDPEAVFRVELKAWEMAGWKDVAALYLKANAPNKGEAVLANLPPGTYDLWREKSLFAGDFGTGVFCDRRDVTVAAGQTAVVEFVRGKAFRITGQTAGLPEGAVPGVFVTVKAAGAEANPSVAQRVSRSDAVVCPPNGQFTTAPIPPGEYVLEASAYKPEPRTDVDDTASGRRGPGFVGSAAVTVPEDGPPGPVRIQLRDLARPAPTTGAGPSGPAAASPPPDEVLRQLEAIVGLEESILAQVEQHYQAGFVAASEVARQETKVTDAKLRLAERKAELAARPGGPRGAIDEARGASALASLRADIQRLLTDAVAQEEKLLAHVRQRYDVGKATAEEVQRQQVRVIEAKVRLAERMKALAAQAEKPGEPAAPVPGAATPSPAATPILKVRSTDGPAVADVHNGMVRVRLGDKVTEGPTIILSLDPGGGARAPRKGIALTVRDGWVRMSADGTETVAEQITIHPDGRLDVRYGEAPDGPRKGPDAPGPGGGRPSDPGRAESGSGPPAGGAKAAPGERVFPLKYREAGAADVLVSGNTFQRRLAGRPAEVKATPASLSGEAAYFSLAVGPRKVLAVLDASSPPRLFVDVAGTGDLSAARPLAAQPWGHFQQFGPVDVPVNGKGGPAARVRFLYAAGESAPGGKNRAAAPADLAVAPAGYMTGEVDLDGQPCRVALVDHGLTGRYGAMLRGEREQGWLKEDTRLAIDLNRDGDFSRSPDAGEMLPFVPGVHVKDAYYSIRTAPDGSSVTLAKAEPEFGTLDTGCPDLSLALVGEHGSHQLNGSQGKWRIPAGWHAAAGASLNGTDAAGAAWTLRGVSSWGKLARFEIRAGETLALRAGPPLTVKVHPSARQPNGMVHLGLALVGQAGENYNATAIKGGAAQPPRFRIFDEAGGVLGAGVFNAGAERTYSWCWWRVPEGFKGKYRVEVEGDWGPFEVSRNPPEWFSVQ